MLLLYPYEMQQSHLPKMWSNQKNSTKFKWDFSFLSNYKNMKKRIVLSPYSLLQSVPISRFCVNCSAVHFSLVQCDLYQL